MKSKSHNLYLHMNLLRASQLVLVVKNLPANAGDIRDADLIPGLGRSPGGEHGKPLQYSCLENPMDKGVWWATVHRVAQSWTQLKWLSMHTCMDLLMTILSIMDDMHSHIHLSHMYVCVLQLLRDMAHKMLWPNNIPLLFWKNFYWRVITLQYCAGFCHTSMWISHRYTYAPFLLNLPGIYHFIPSL